MSKEPSDKELAKSYKLSEFNLKHWFGDQLYKLQSSGHDVEDYIHKLSREAQRRWEICEECPSLIRFNRCEDCGCFMKLKTKVAKAECPRYKWGVFEYEAKKLDK